MCLAIPTQVVELLENSMARARVGGGPTVLDVSTMLLPEPPKVGDWLIVHAGFALSVMDPEEARRSLETLLQCARAAGGDGSPAPRADAPGPSGI